MSLTAHETALIDRLSTLATLSPRGKVCGVTGPVVRVRGLNANIGRQVDLWTEGGGAPIPAEVIGLEDETLLLMALDELEGIGVGCEAVARPGDTMAKLGDELLGRIIDGLGRPLDGMPLPPLPHRRSLRGKPPGPMERQRITEVLHTGVRAIDTMLTIGQGQRMGIFAGAGVGKSTLLSMLARHGDFDVCVVSLIGERGREVREFVEDAITDKNRQRTCVVAVTGDQAPLTRIRGALLSTTIAEYFSAQGRNVVLLFDSLTRYAMALREVGLASGEMPATKGYPPSVFVELARLLERAGNYQAGCITGIYTVLVEGDDLADPVADSTRALLDGHAVLSRDLAAKGIFPALEILDSKSRLMSQITSKEMQNISRRTISILAAHRQAEDLIRIGAYKPGSDKEVDIALSFVPRYLTFLAQEQSEKTDYELAANGLKKLIDKYGRMSTRGSTSAK